MREKGGRGDSFKNTNKNARVASVKPQTTGKVEKQRRLFLTTFSWGGKRSGASRRSRGERGKGKAKLFQFQFCTVTKNKNSVRTKKKRGEKTWVGRRPLLTKGGKK